MAIPAIAPLYSFMNTEDWWHLDALPDQRAALFTLVEEPPPEDYTLQRFNRRMDYSFAPPLIRARLTGQAATG